MHSACNGKTDKKIWVCIEKLDNLDIQLGPDLLCTFYLSRIHWLGPMVTHAGLDDICNGTSVYFWIEAMPQSNIFGLIVLGDF
jgi:hypothetical protein